MALSAAAPRNPTTDTLQSSIHGMADVNRRLLNEEVVAIPTECTYEACISLSNFRKTEGSSSNHKVTVSPQDWAYRIQQVQQIASASTGEERKAGAIYRAPYCWVPRSADCSLLRYCFPVSSYGIRPSNGQTRVTHRFNESHEVIQRLARHLWPGPVSFHVAVPMLEEKRSNNKAVESSHRSSYWSTLTFPHPRYHVSSSVSDGASCPHLTLRCPRHPLAIKVYQEHSNRLENETASAEEVSNLPEPDGASFGVLVGFPLLKEDLILSDDSTKFCTSSQDVQRRQNFSAGCTVSAVLDGENHSEPFAVPTCEYGQPFQSQVWIHGPTRTVTLVNRRSGGDSQSSALGTCANLFSLNANGQKGLDSVATLSADRIRSFLRQRVARRVPLSKEKDQITQAILSKWTVIEATGEKSGN